MKQICRWLLVCLLGVPTSGQGQTIPVGQLDYDALLRNLQLKGELDPAISFSVRPFHFETASKGKTGSLHRNRLLQQIDSSAALQFREYPFAGSGGELVVLPALFKFKFNSHHPYGWNDEGMLAAKGAQTQLSAGVFARYGPLSVQLQPQWVMASNPTFRNNAAYGAPTTGSMHKLYAGQSAIRLNAGPLSLGFSSENGWWGPGQFSSLLLSNNAPGFMHVTLNTTRPVKTAIGSFEFQLVGGRLNEDSAAGGLYENFHLKPSALKDDWRYINAIVFTYQPRFLPGFFLGATRAFQLYQSDFDLQSGSFINKYIPVLSALFKNDAGGGNEDTRARDQQISLFTRWLFPGSHAECYFEYGWNDHKANARDFFVDPTHASAYILGGKKLFPLKDKDSWIELSGELTQMAQSVNYIVRNAGNWYVHGQVQQGMTHQRQILGAGSGFGNNLQTLYVSWLRGVKKAGLIFQRIQHDPMALAGSFNNNGLRDIAWNELAIGIQAGWNFGKWLTGIDLQHVRSKNYAWEKNGNVSNIYGFLNLGYVW